MQNLTTNNKDQNLYDTKEKVDKLNSLRIELNKVATSNENGKRKF